MKGPLLLLLPLVGILSGCATPDSSSPSSRPPVNETSCRAAVRDALVYKSNTSTTLSFFGDLVRGGEPAKKRMDSYYNTLGINLSSVAFVLNEELEEKISINLKSVSPDILTNWLSNRIPNGKSLVDLEDIDGTFFDDEFLRVDLKTSSMVTGYFYVHCGVIEDRDIAEKVYVDYFQEGAKEPRKLSLAALLRLM